MRLRKLFAATHGKRMFAVLAVLTAAVGLVGAITYEPPLRAKQDGSGTSTTSIDAEDHGDSGSGNALERQTAAEIYASELT